MLIESRPSDPGNSLGLCFCWREFDNLAFEVEGIARPHRGKPAQIVDAKAQ
jgi:hypothetical protein